MESRSLLLFFSSFLLLDGCEAYRSCSFVLASSLLVTIIQSRKKKHMETIVDIAALSTICTHIDGHARFLVEKRQPRV